MTDIEKLSIFPAKRIKAMDGLAVSADLWESAHQEHRDAARGHTAALHGEGIITGLEVIANDPPNNLVYISPGAAVDREGNVIVVSERIAYDFGDTNTGELFLLLAQGTREVAGEAEGSVYIQQEFMIAARSSMSKRPSVELARVSRTTPGQAISNATVPQRPGAGQIDLRYRDELVIPRSRRERCTLVDLDNDANTLKGLDALAKEARRVLDLRLLVETSASIPTDSAVSDFIFISFGAKSLSKGRSEDLKALVANGGKIFIETGSDEGFEGIKTLLDEVGAGVVALGSDHPLLQTPYRFAKPPMLEAGMVLVGENVILAHGGYSAVWAGVMNGDVAERDTIRTAQEWGINLIAYLLG